MSVSKWAYSSKKCDGKPCVGDCDFCPLQYEDDDEPKKCDRKEVEEMNSIFYDNVKYLAKKKHIKLGEVLKKAGEYPTYLSKNKGDWKHVYLNVAMEFSKALGFSVEDLVNTRIANAYRQVELEAQIAELQEEIKELRNGR